MSFNLWCGYLANSPQSSLDSGNFATSLESCLTRHSAHVLVLALGWQSANASHYDRMVAERLFNDKPRSVVLLHNHGGPSWRTITPWFASLSCGSHVSYSHCTPTSILASPQTSQGELSPNTNHHGAFRSIARPEKKVSCQPQRTPLQMRLHSVHSGWTD